MKKSLLGLLLLICIGSTCLRAAQQNYTTSTFSWPGGTMTINANVVVGQNSAAFSGNTAAAAALYTASGTLVATYTSSNGTAAVAAGDAVVGDVLDAATINFGSVSAGTYKITYTGTKAQKSPDINSYYYAYWSSTPVPTIATTFSLSSTSFTYNGSAQGPSVVANPSGATFSTGGTLSATNAGTYTATATATGNYSGSNTGLTWTINKANQSTVTISPTSQTITAGQNVPFTASGGSGTGAYTWGGDASGTGSSNTVTFNTVGTHTVTVYCAADGNYNASNTATATITVNPAPASFSLSSTSFTYNGSAQGPSVVASPSGATYSTSGTLSATAAGTYSVTVTATGNYSGSNTLSWTINKANQPAATISPSTTQTTSVGGTITFTAGGGAGTGAYTWNGTDASGTGGTKVVTFSTAGGRSVGVFRAGDSNYNDSSTASVNVTVNPIATTFSLNATSFTYNGSAQGPTIVTNPTGASYNSGGTLSATNVGTYTATATANGNYTGTNNALTWTINPASQATVTISPTSQSTTYGGSVTFTASGGSGTGAYVWGGDASGSGSSNTVTFNTVGTRSVTVYRASDSNYNASNTATATVTVAGANTTFSINGPFTYDGTAKTATITVSPSNATFTTGGTLTATSPGTYVATATANGNYAGSNNNLAWTINKGVSSMSLTPTTQTVAVGRSVTFTAGTGASTGGFVWGGSASGTGSSVTVTFNTVGTSTVTVYQQGDSLYNDSAVVTAAITVVAPQNDTTNQNKLNIHIP